ncbi:shikimate kinase [Cruoricaptor ignavus]|uniref:shikimate kinase n=1 Tax=Cruoricaptor ignavus TaxID=1118202 RepID=UPI00370D63CE
MIISLAGYMGSGKSLIANDLAKKLNFKAVDLDQEIIAENQLEISEIFEKQGEFFFRKAERKILEKILNAPENSVLSLGGGTPAYFDNIHLLNQKSFSVFLQASVKTLSERLQSEKSERPLIAKISDEDLPEFIAKHLFERNPYYTQCQAVISVDGKTAQEVSDEIIRLLPAF